MKRNLIRAGRFLKRWYRFAIPLGLVLVVTVFTLVTHALQSDDVTNGDYLNPASQAPIGAATLAGRLTASGVTVITEHGGDQALITAETGDATLFLPAPSLLNSHQLAFLTNLPSNVTVVVVAPDRGTIDQTDFPVSDINTHWSTRTAAPDCDDPEANAAGRTGVDGSEYRGEVDACYHGALVQLRGTTPEVLLAGASDVFRNDRIGESGNRTLAMSLLDSHPRLIWLDIHRPEPAPVVRTVAPDDTASPDAINEGGGGNATGYDRSDKNQNSGGGDQAEQPRGSIARLFPPWLWTTVGLVALIMAVLALAAARRMGPPVTEPMPVTARLRESVEGRGRLYRRARQHSVTLDVLRQAAVARLAGMLGMPARTPVGTLLDLVSERTGLTRKTVDGILRDDRPRDNAELVDATRRLDRLMELLAESVGARPTRASSTASASDGRSTDNVPATHDGLNTDTTGRTHT